MKEVTKKLIVLREKLSKANIWHCERIQDILKEKESGSLDINLDIRMKVHNQSHSILVATIKDIEQIMREDDPDGYNELLVNALNSSNESKPKDVSNGESQAGNIAGNEDEEVKSK